MHANNRWNRIKGYRREMAEQRTGWNTYSIHDHEAVGKRLERLFSAKAAAAHAAGLPIPTQGDLDRAAVQHGRRYRKFRGEHRYLPHQSTKECMRRRHA